MEPYHSKLTNSQTSNLHIPQKVDKIQRDLTKHVDDSTLRFGNMGKEIQIISSNYVTEVGECRRSSDGLERRLSKMEEVCGRLDSFSDSLQKITEGLNRHVSCGCGPVLTDSTSP